MQAPDGLSDEEFKFGLKIINDESERLMGLVENLLDFSRYQSGRIKLITSEVKIDKLVNEAAFQLLKKADKKGIKFILETVPVTITADNHKLKQVILNVLDNAIKFSYKDSTIKIHQSITEEGVLIEISDNGMGVEQENLQHITESFYKINQKSIGSGLGLAISKNIIDLHGGALQINSLYGKGTTVKIMLLRELEKTS
jgi:signal transduction histidine kinase